VIGDITTPSLTIAQGAKIESYIDMSPAPKPIELNDKKNKKTLEHKKDKNKTESEEEVKKLA